MKYDLLSERGLSFSLAQMQIKSDPFRCQFNLLISDGIQVETKVKQLVPRFVCGSRGNIKTFQIEFNLH